MVMGSATITKSPVNVSTPQVLDKQHGNATQRLRENRTSRTDVESLKHSPSGCSCSTTVKEVTVVSEATAGKTVVRVGVGLQEDMKL